MKVRPTSLPGVVIVESEVLQDSRGVFFETFHVDKYREAGLPTAFVQDNCSRSVRDTLRGLHLQVPRPQGKLIRVVAGEVFDVAVDLRRGSPTYRRWAAVTLSAKPPRQLYIPPGFAHGFCVTSDVAEVEYKCTDIYRQTDELTVRWDDPDLAIAWPVRTPILSKKDQAAPRLIELEARFPRLEEDAT